MEMDLDNDDQAVLLEIQDQLERIGDSFSLQQIQETLNSLGDFSQDLIVTCLPECVFKSPICQNEFQHLFQQYDANCRFAYLPSFSRAKVMMNDLSAAISARCYVNKKSLLSHTVEEATAAALSVQKEVQIGVFFCQSPNNLLSNLGIAFTGSHLLPPKPEKQFLLSPPASPPVGWEPKEESEPCLNYDLIAALSKLAPGEVHELQPSVDDKPSIILTPCFDDEELKDYQPKVKIVQTKCPDRRG